MKKNLCIILATLLLITCLCACAGDYKEPPRGGFIVTEHFTGYRLGIVKGQIDAEKVKAKIDDPVIVSLKTVDEGLDALRNKEIHGLVLPAVYANPAVENSFDFEKLMDTFEKKELQLISLNSSELKLPIDAAITLIKNNGTIEKITASHISDSSASGDYKAPEDYEKVDGRTLTVGLPSEDDFPYTYHDAAGNITGINADVAREIAAEYAAELEIKEYPESKLTKALEDGEVDFIMSQFTREDGAPKGYVYSDPYFDASTYILIRSPLADVNAKNPQ